MPLKRAHMPCSSECSTPDLMHPSRARGTGLSTPALQSRTRYARSAEHEGSVSLLVGEHARIEHGWRVAW